MTYNSAYTGPQIDSAARLASVIFDDIADMLADARTYSDHTAEDVFWTAAEGFRYEVAASDATDHHLATAGSVKLYVLPCDNGSYNFGAFNPAADGVTDDHAKLMLAIEAASMASRALGPVGARSELLIPDADYFIGATVNIKAEISIVGNYGSIAAPDVPKLIFAADTLGIIINRFNTYDVFRVWSNSSEAAVLAHTGTYADYDTGSAVRPAVIGDYHVVSNGSSGFRIAPSDATDHDETNAGGVKLYRLSAADARWKSDAGDGTVLKGIHLFSQGGTDEEAHGIWLRGFAHLEAVNVQKFPGHGFYIAGGTDGNPHLGVPNLFSIMRCSAVANQRSGFYVRGTDANAGVGQNLDATGNGRWGIEDRSFLGCTWIACHSSINGANSLPGSKTSIALYEGVHYHANPGATEADYVNTQPGTNKAVWQVCGVSFNNVTWVPGLPEGTYKAGGPFYSPGANAHTVWLNCYVEEGHGAVWMGQHSQYLGAIVNTQVLGAGAYFKTISGENLGPCFRAIADNTTLPTVRTRATLGGNGNGRRILSTNVDSLDEWVLRWKSDNTVIGGEGYGDAGIAFIITTSNSSFNMGRSQNQPNLFTAPSIGIGAYSACRRHTTLDAAPTTGEWARGDRVYHRDPSAGGFEGWVCVTAGTFGATDPVFKQFGAIEA